ncbi:hypothetical protein [Metakosakonia massiliensis]|uniref:Uncharacterized protein n=1 Tax=Phytobacter massiliensis TaxID=1485952 RepID=A0A6N3HA02_9ENTR|nr:hypothetical protein [Phytobacter massiliensis]
MNIVLFQVERLPQQKNNFINFTLKSVQLLRDKKVIAELGDVRVDKLPFYYFCAVPTGFSKIEFTVKNKPPLRLVFRAGYLKSGDYIIATPAGEITLGFNALTGIWSDKQQTFAMSHQQLTEREYVLLRPARVYPRHAPPT